MNANGNVKALKGLEVEAGVALASEITAEIQDVTIMKTIDHKNDPNSEKSWQGYMVRFAETSAGVPKVVPISAGRLLAIQQEKNIEIFAESDAGFELVNFRMGIDEKGGVQFED